MLAYGFWKKEDMSAEGLKPGAVQTVTREPPHLQQRGTFTDPGLVWLQGKLKPNKMAYINKEIEKEVP